MEYEFVFLGISAISLYGSLAFHTFNLINIPRVFFPQSTCLVMNDFDGI
jgi:hypothetical protein